jgi:hypothetical protein
MLITGGYVKIWFWLKHFFNKKYEGTVLKVLNQFSPNVSDRPHLPHEQT